MALPDVMRADAVRSRERRVLHIGTAVAVAALLLTFVVLPFARRWMDRERTLDAARARVAYLEQVISRTASLETAATEAERALSTAPRRVLHARSATLAASTLQSLLQDAADASHVVVTRLEVAPETPTTDPAPTDAVAAGSGSAVSNGAASLPATFSAYGDIAGVAKLLDLLARGSRVVVIDKLAVQRNAALLGAADVVQVTMTVRAPVLPDGGSRE